MGTLVARIARRGRRILTERRPPAGDLEYWERRVRRMGAAAVAHVGHRPEELAEVTRRQGDTLFPLLAGALSGRQEMILDYGCGCGRFTPGLAQLTGGRALGVDPVQRLLDLAPSHPRVEYRRLGPDGAVPLGDGKADAVWTALVLGNVTTPAALRRASSEITRVLRPGGAFLLAENTSDRPDSHYQIFRSVERYRELFPDIDLRHVLDYDDLGETVSVLVGRRR